MVGAAMLAALIVVFQVIGNFITIGPISINLSLLPIAIGAILYGPWVGLFLGVINGFSVMPVSGFFFGINAFATFACCLLKTGLAGFIAGWVFKLFKNKWTIPEMFISSLLVPVINTGVFTVFALTFFKKGIADAFGIEEGNFMSFYFLTFIGVNFIFEFLTSLLLSPTLVYVIKVVTKRYDIGDNLGDKLSFNKKSVEENGRENEQISTTENDNQEF